MIATNDSGYFTDLWSLGVIIYEMMIGFSPFTAINESQIFENILKHRLCFPPQVDPHGANLINDLLNRDVFERLDRCSNAKLKAHPFFNGINWEQLAIKKVSPPNIEIP